MVTIEGLKCCYKMLQFISLFLFILSLWFAIKRVWLTLFNIPYLLFTLFNDYYLGMFEMPKPQAPPIVIERPKIVEKIVVNKVVEEHLRARVGELEEVVEDLRNRLRILSKPSWQMPDLGPAFNKFHRAFHGFVGPYVEEAKKNFLSAIGLVVLVIVIGLMASYIIQMLLKSFVKVRNSKPALVLDTFVEKMRAGSLLEPIKIVPSFMAQVYIRAETGVFFVSGQGFLTKHGFMTANHVVENAYEIKLVSSGGQMLVLPKERFNNVEADVAVAKLTQAEATQLKLTQAKLHENYVDDRAGLIVKAVANGQQSMGLLRSSDAMGICVYDGSTLPGFSGTPYHIGKQVYGMHIGGSSKNIGYDSAYLKMVCSGNESTEDFLLSQISRNAAHEVSWVRSPYEPDEVRVKYGGKYYLASLDFVNKLGKRAKQEYNQPDYEEECDLDSLDDLPLAPRGDLQYVDESAKNLRRPSVNAGADGKESVQENVQSQSIMNTKKPSNTKGLLAFVDLDTAGRERMLAQRRKALEDTQASFSSLERLHKKLTVVNDGKC